MSFKYSEYKIFQSIWFVSSVYLGFMISDLAKEVIIPQVFEANISVPTLLLSVVTLVIYFWIAVETYIWLNPSEKRGVSPIEAVFDFALLILFVISIISHSLLYYSIKGQVDEESIAIWGKSFSFILIVYSFYNVLEIVKTAYINGISNIVNDENKKSVKYIVHYFFFALLFYSSAEYLVETELLSITNSAILFTVLFVLYFSTYISVWWSEWHKVELEHVIE